MQHDHKEETRSGFVAKLVLRDPVPAHYFPSPVAATPGFSRLSAFLTASLDFSRPKTLSLTDCWFESRDRLCRTIFAAFSADSDFSLAQLLTTALEMGFLAQPAEVSVEGSPIAPVPPPKRRERFACGVFSPDTVASPEGLLADVGRAIGRDTGFARFCSFSVRPLRDGGVFVEAYVVPAWLWVLNYLPVPSTGSLVIKRYVSHQRWCSRCLRKGHSASSCQSPVRCTRCGSEGHLLSSCPDPRGSCLACGSPGHLFHRCNMVRGAPQPVHLPLPPSVLDDIPIKEPPAQSPSSLKVTVADLNHRLKEEFQQFRAYLQDTLDPMQRDIRCNNTSVDRYYADITELFEIVGRLKAAVFPPKGAARHGRRKPPDAI